MRPGYGDGMVAERAGHFEVRLSDGMRIDRLPAGWAAGHWWINFIFSEGNFHAGARPLSARMWDEIPEVLRFEGEHGRITLPPTASGDGAFDGDIYWAHYQFKGDLQMLEISYLDGGAKAASERLDLA
jgi:hypothetical protein